MATKPELPTSPLEDASSAPSGAAGTPVAGGTAARPATHRPDDVTPLEQVAGTIPPELTVDSALEAFIARASLLEPTEWRASQVSARELDLEERVERLERELSRIRAEPRSEVSGDSRATFRVDPTTAVAISPLGAERQRRRWLPLVTFAAGIALVLLLLWLGRALQKPSAPAPTGGADDQVESDQVESRVHPARGGNRSAEPVGSEIGSGVPGARR